MERVTGDSKIAKELGKLIEGDVLFDELSRQEYATAACIFKVRPLGAVCPKTKKDVEELVQYARAHQITLTPRGGGSSLSGQALGAGIVVDFSRYMNRVVSTNPEEKTIRVQPGLIYTKLNQAAAKYNLFLPPDPSSGSYCTVGGMIANNSAGAHTVFYGTTRDFVASLETVTSDSSLVETSQLVSILNLPADISNMLKQTEKLLLPNRQTILASTVQVSKNSAGYNLDGALKNGSIDFTQLLVGSEGTLGIVTEATLQLLSKPPHRAVTLLYFDDWEKASQTVVELLKLRPSALELVDETFVAYVRKGRQELRPFLPEKSTAVILLEFEGQTLEEVKEKISAGERAAGPFAFGTRAAFGPKEQNALWETRRAALPIVYKASPIKKPMNFIDDSAVPPQNLGRYINGLKQIMEKRGIELVIFGHAGNGNVHITPLMDPHEPGFENRLVEISDEAFDLTLKLGGTISAEHGDGVMRAPYLKKQYPKTYPLFERLKKIWDPEAILNPGKIVTDYNHIPVNVLRFPKTFIQTGTVFDQPRWRIEIEKCHGCGACRNYCPVAAETEIEPATARAKPNLLLGIITGELPTGLLFDERFKNVADLCFNCRLCLSECPTAVNVPDLAILARTAYAEKHGQTLRNKVLSHSDTSSELASLLPKVTNWALNLRLNRIFMERILGIHRDREFAAALKPFHLNQKTTYTSKRKVAYFAGCFARFNDVNGEAQATLKVMEKNDIEVLVPQQKCCGIAMITVGSEEDAKKNARFNVEVLAPLVKQGYEIVTSAPSCALAIFEDYPRLLNNEDAHLVSQATKEIHQYLWDLYQHNELNRNFKPVDLHLVWHNPCHSKALGVEREPIELLRLIPGVKVEEIADSCCGMAGTFGFKTENFDLSMKIGARLFEEIKRTGVTTVATSCGTCNMQIAQGTRLPVRHTLSILAEAYRE